MQAALVAAKNSEAKHSSLVPVDHTLRKHVRKPRGSAPGFVTYRNEKTLDVAPNL
jgi:predicted ribosome quality control (RQC) complex YloA/Tae2 family protein